MKQLYNSKRILAFILTFIMIASNIKLIPVYATGEVATTETVLFSTDFDNPNVNSNGVTARGTGTVQVSSEGDEKYLEFLGTTTNKRVATKLDLSGKDNLTVEMKVKTTGDVKACIGLSYKDQSYENDNSKNYSWTGSTNGAWQEVKVVYSLEDTVTSTAYIKNGNDWEESTTYTHLFPANENDRYLILKPLTNLTGDTTVCFDAVKVYYTETSTDATVAVTDVTINDGAETVDVETGKTTTLTVTVTPENATDKTVTWSSGNVEVATVDAVTGVVTGVSAGSATITATVGENVTDTITVNVTPAYVAQIGDEKYETLQDAIIAAKDEDTITLLKNIVSENDLTIGNGITLDLNGKTLTASTLASFGGYVIDNSDDKDGLLKVAEDKVIFSTTTNNPQMPVYNGTDGYVFADIVKQEQRNSDENADIFELVFRPSLGTSTVVNNTLLADGGDAAKITIGIRLEGADANGTPFETKILVYDDTMIDTVYSEGKAFYIKASGVNSFKNVKITPFVQSQLNDSIVWNGTTFEAN